MQILKLEKIIKSYILLIIFLPLSCYVFSILIKFLFYSGKYCGTFIRALYELVLKSL